MVVTDQCLGALGARAEGPLHLDGEVDHWIETLMKAVPLRQAPITIEIARRVAEVPHNDPADAFLVATARALDLTLVTADRKLLALGDLNTLPAN